MKEYLYKIHSEILARWLTWSCKTILPFFFFLFLSKIILFLPYIPFFILYSLLSHYILKPSTPFSLYLFISFSSLLLFILIYLYLIWIKMDNKNEQKVINQETRTKVEMRTGFKSIISYLSFVVAISVSYFFIIPWFLCSKLFLLY